MMERWSFIVGLCMTTLYMAWAHNVQLFYELRPSGQGITGRNGGEVSGINVRRCSIRSDISDFVGFSL